MKQRATIQIRSLMRAVAVLFLALSLVFGTQPAWATVEEGDQSSLTEEEIQVAIEAGEIETVDDQSADESADNTSETSEDDTEEASSSAVAESSVSVRDSSSTASLSTASVQGDVLQAFSGSNRIETSALQAVYGWTQSDYVILVGSNSWADALSASGLAGALDCPILLTSTTQLESTTEEALTTLSVKYAIVLGDSNSVDDDVISNLESMGISCERVYGSDRFKTNLAIYEYGAEHNLWQGEYLVIASGETFADALSYSPVAYAQAAPVFLTNSSGGFSTEQEAALISGAKDGLFEHVILLGSTDRISSATEGYVKALCQISSESSDPVKRIAGSDRYETSAQIAEWAVSEGLLSWDKMALTTGEKPYDSLGGGALQGKEGAVLLLVRESSDNPALDAAESAYKAGATISTVKFFGDKNSVPNIIRMDVADRFGFAYSDIAGLKVYIDAGHGYNSSNNGVLDSGASGSGYLEYNLTSDLANRVADVLESTYGIEVYVNDDGGYYALRHAEAISLGCDLIVSIHFNSTSSGTATGTESYIHSTNASWKSADLQSKVHSALVSALGLTDRGMKSSRLAVVSGSLPAVLLEICFIDNASDMSTYMSKIDEVAAGIAAGIAS